jgi:hypothetical protein
VPLAAIGAAHFINIPMMRQTELTEGITVCFWCAFSVFVCMKPENEVLSGNPLINRAICTNVLTICNNLLTINTKSQVCSEEGVDIGKSKVAAYNAVSQVCL